MTTTSQSTQSSTNTNDNQLSQEILFNNEEPDNNTINDQPLLSTFKENIPFGDIMTEIKQ
jgi:hypothetical protein